MNVFCGATCPRRIGILTGQRSRRRKSTSQRSKQRRRQLHLLADERDTALRKHYRHIAAHGQSALQLRLTVGRPGRPRWQQQQLQRQQRSTVMQRSSGSRSSSSSSNKAGQQRCQLLRHHCYRRSVSAVGAMPVRFIQQHCAVWPSLCRSFRRRVDTVNDMRLSPCFNVTE